MKSLSFIPEENRELFFIPLYLTLSIIIILTVLILILNSGLFVYIIDDSYIHLALAENINKGHYGINPDEYSSPSSSIIWPFILALFFKFKVGYFAPLIVNILAAAGTLYIYSLIINSLVSSSLLRNSPGNKLSLLLIFLLIIATNLIGSVFGGMEHQLQLFFTVTIIWGLISEILNKKFSLWFFAAVIIAPLIRYENLALSVAALIFLFVHGYKIKSIVSFIAILLLTGAFSFFLLSLKLEPLPSSILIKLSVTSSDQGILSVFSNFKDNILNSRCTLLFLLFVYFLFASFSGRNKRDERLLAACISAAILLHMFFGKAGRYVVYIWAASLIILLFINRERIIKAFTGRNYLKAAIATSIIFILISYNYIYGTIMIPLASNNIYEQQYQMHRFAVYYYKKPVAVNDLGFAAFKNDNYVLDLVGLASFEVQKLKEKYNSPDWFNKATELHNVKFAMIYDRWFPVLPSNWEKTAELYLGKKKIAPAESIVAFYVTDRKVKREIIPILEKFKSTLPSGVRLEIKN